MTTLKIDEGRPNDWQDAPQGPSTRAARLSPAIVWRRLEVWIAWRWGERPCTFIVEGGCGAWRAPLTPFVIETTEVWDGDTWAAVTLPTSPLGGVQIGDASHYRFTGTLGADEDPPEDVLEAYARLAEYSVEKRGLAGSSSRTVELGGELRESYDRAPTWLARAIQYSGAADLLRPYRRAP